MYVHRFTHIAHTMASIYWIYEAVHHAFVTLTAGKSHNVEKYNHPTDKLIKSRMFPVHAVYINIYKNKAKHFIYNI